MEIQTRIVILHASDFRGAKNIPACDIVVIRRALLQCYYDIEIICRRRRRRRRRCESLLLKKTKSTALGNGAESVMLQYNIIAIRYHRRWA